MFFALSFRDLVIRIIKHLKSNTRNYNKFRNKI